MNPIMLTVRGTQGNDMSQMHRIAAAARILHRDLEPAACDALVVLVREFDFLVRHLDDGTGRSSSEAHLRLSLALRLVRNPETDADRLVDQWSKASKLCNPADELH